MLNRSATENVHQIYEGKEGWVAGSGVDSKMMPGFSVRCLIMMELIKEVYGKLENLKQ